MRCFAYGCGPRAQEPCEPCQAGNRAALSGGLLVLRSVRIRMQSSAAAGHTPRGPCPFFYAAKYFTGGGCIVPCAVPQVASAQVSHAFYSRYMLLILFSNLNTVFIILSRDNADTICRLANTMINICLCISTFDACKQIF